MPNFLPEKLAEVNEVRRAVQKRTFSYVAAGLGLVAGLAWNDAIRAAIDYLVPDLGSTVIAKLLYALVVTAIVGFLLYYAEKVTEGE